MADPASTPLLDPQALARLMAQPLLTRFPMEGSISGQHKSPHRGSSVEFAEYRNYVPGDDLRRLDWRVFGRTDRFYLKEFEAETNLRAYILMDCSGSMNFAAAHGSRLDYARRLAATLAYLVIHQGDAAGLICAGGTRLPAIPPKRTPAHLQLIVQTIESAQAKGETELTGALHDLAEQIRPRGLVIVLSDLFCEPKSLLDAVQHLRFKKHDVALFHLLDRAELEFRFDRPVRFADLESNASIITEPAMIRDEYLKAVNAFIERLKTGCHEYKAEYRQIVTDTPYDQVLADFLVERAQFQEAR